MLVTQSKQKGSFNSFQMNFQVADGLIYVYFAGEMLIKMVAMGVVGRGCYLQETWNKLDCFIVISGALEYLMDVEKPHLSAIRTVRVLRPLKAINRIPSMRFKALDMDNSF